MFKPAKTVRVGDTVVTNAGRGPVLRIVDRVVHDEARKLVLITLYAESGGRPTLTATENFLIHVEDPPETGPTDTGGIPQDTEAPIPPKGPRMTDGIDPNTGAVVPTAADLAVWEAERRARQLVDWAFVRRTTPLGSFDTWTDSVAWVPHDAVNPVIGVATDDATARTMQNAFGTLPWACSTTVSRVGPYLAVRACKPLRKAQLATARAVLYGVYAGINTIDSPHVTPEDLP